MLLLLINLLLCFLFFCFVPCLLCVSFGHFFFLVSYHLSTFHLWPLRWMMTVTGVHEVNSLWNTGQLLGIWAFSSFSSLPHLLQRIFCVRVCSVMSDSLKPHGRQPTRLLCPWKFPGKRTGVGAIAFSIGNHISINAIRKNVTENCKHCSLKEHKHTQAFNAGGQCYTWNVLSFCNYT